MVSYISVDNVSVIFGDRLVLSDISFTVSVGERVGIVGENGVGKSTLLKLIAKEYVPDSGSISTPHDYGYLPQEVLFSVDSLQQSVGQVIDAAIAEAIAVRSRVEELADQLALQPEDQQLLAEYGQLLECAQEKNVWDAERRAMLIYDMLGLGEVSTETFISHLSGGQRVRLGIAVLLITQPKVLILDEPTNHLDATATAFLTDYICSSSSIVVVVSHDRVFLEEVCTSIIDLDPTRGGVTFYGGAYSAYLLEKQREYEHWLEQFASEQEEIKKLNHSVQVTARDVAHNRVMSDNNKLGYNARAKRVEKQISRRVRNAQLRLDALKETQVRKPPRKLNFSGNLTQAYGSDALLMYVRNIVIPNRLQIKSLDIFSLTRLLVTGPNGSGKSTLLRLLSGHLIAEQGEVYRAKGVTVGLLEQDSSFIDMSRTAQTYWQNVRVDFSLMELGLFTPKELNTPISELSTGQRRRLQLALIMAKPPHILLLDEPTNHLSLNLVEELEEALAATPGAYIIASHDRWLRNHWRYETLALK